MHYDPMIAKLVTHGSDREHARKLMLAALERYRIRGVSHNVNFLHSLMAHPRPLTTHYSLPATYYLLLTTHSPLLTTHYLLPTAYYLLLTSYCLLLTTHYLLLTTYFTLWWAITGDSASQAGDRGRALGGDRARKGRRRALGRAKARAQVRPKHG